MISYLLVALLATLIGSIAGLGGGVIIKPMLDLMGDYNIVTISLLSSITVLSMAIASTISCIKDGFRVKGTMVAVSIGAVAGGMLGSLIFSMIKKSVDNDIVTVVQSAILICLLVFCLFYNYQPRYKIKSIVSKCIIGVFLGMVSTFLGIGGGPINVAVLFVLLGLKTRDAAKVSIFIIIFSQTAGLIVKAANGMFAQAENFNMLFVMIPAAIIGGLLGSKLSHKLPVKSIRYVYKGVVVLVIFICAYNIIALI